MSETFNTLEKTKLEKYFQAKFHNKDITIVQRKDIEDSVEVMLNGEFLGVIYKDDDEGEVSYDFNMAILDMDLPE